MNAVVGRVTSCASSASKPELRKPAASGDAVFSQSAPGTVAGLPSAQARPPNIPAAGRPRRIDRAATLRVIKDEAAIDCPPCLCAGARLPVAQLGVDGVAQ